MKVGNVVILPNGERDVITSVDDLYVKLETFGRVGIFTSTYHNMKIDESISVITQKADVKTPLSILDDLLKKSEERYLAVPLTLEQKRGIDLSIAELESECGKNTHNVFEKFICITKNTNDETSSHDLADDYVADNIIGIGFKLTHESPYHVFRIKDGHKVLKVKSTSDLLGLVVQEIDTPDDSDFVKYCKRCPHYYTSYNNGDIICKYMNKCRHSSSKHIDHFEQKE